MRLSIITINRNNAEGLKKTIESVLAQIFTDFEYIVVDGASTDDSVEIIKQYNDSGIEHYTWISEQDTGVYQAMNKGIRMASGEYLLFLNSGDFLVNKYVLNDVFKSIHTADLLLGLCNISENGKVIHTTSPPQKVTFGHLYGAGLAHQATFIKRELFKKYGYYREDFRYNSDIEFWYRTIILQFSTTETLTIIISDYNTDGISSKESGSKAYQNEMAEIYSHPLLQLFVPDYEALIEEKKEMQILYWYKEKRFLYTLLLFIYNVIHRMSLLNKRRLKNIEQVRRRSRNIARKLYYQWTKPISIFACHQISENFNPRVDCFTDWTLTELFARNVEWLSQNYTFISLKEAVSILESGKRRRRKFAVMTFDDGYASVLNALPILKKYQIPATIFINSAYLDDNMLSTVNAHNYVNSMSPTKIKELPPDFLKAIRKLEVISTDKEYEKYISVLYKYINLIKPDVSVYLTKEELYSITDPLFTIGLHGHEHLVSTHLSNQLFEKNLQLNYLILKDHTNFIPYYAFPFGSSDNAKINVVSKMGYVPFLCNGLKNFKATKAYNRIPIDGVDLASSNVLKY